MQRCPYLHEMKERLLSDRPAPTCCLDESFETMDGVPLNSTPAKEAAARVQPGVIPQPPEMPPDSLIGTVVKVDDHGGQRL